MKAIQLGSSDSVKIFSEEFKQSDKMAFLLEWVGSPCRRWRELFGPLLLDIIRQKSLRQILFLDTSEFQEVVDWIIHFDSRVLSIGAKIE